MKIQKILFYSLRHEMSSPLLLEFIQFQNYRMNLTSPNHHHQPKLITEKSTRAK